MNARMIRREAALLLTWRDFDWSGEKVKPAQHSLQPKRNPEPGPDSLQFYEGRESLPSATATRISQQPSTWRQGLAPASLDDSEHLLSINDFKIKVCPLCFKTWCQYTPHTLQYRVNITICAPGNPKIDLTRFIAMFTLLWWSGTEPALSLGSACMKGFYYRCCFNKTLDGATRSLL